MKKKAPEKGGNVVDSREKTFRHPYKNETEGAVHHHGAQHLYAGDILGMTLFASCQ